MENLLTRITRNYIKIKTRLVICKGYDVEIEPFKLYEVNPEKIKYIISPEGRQKFQCADSTPEIVGGDWDKEIIPLESYDLYVAIQNRYEKNMDWEKTDFFTRVAKEIKNEKKFGVSSITEFRNRLNKIDRVADCIQHNGYQTQAELANKDTCILSSHIPSIKPPEVHEISINIDRNGSYILHEGRHRLSLAHALDLDLVPVRIKARHREWLNDSSTPHI